MKLSLIVAASENNVIGLNNDLPWRLSSDLKHFKKITSGHCIIMGRNTYESIGRPLPKRTNIVVTSNENLRLEGCVMAHSLKEAIEKAKEFEKEEAFIIGGATLYKACLNDVDNIYLTRVHAKVKGDTFFPEINQAMWKTVSEDKHTADEKNQYDFSFYKLERI